MQGRDVQRVRIRLARQRPGLVRPRERAAEPEAEPASGRASWWRRIPWVHVGAVVGALAAIGGLVFTSIATYYSAAVSNDQLQQSREDAEREARSQANRVTYWLTSDEKGDQVLHVVNRSPDPITRMEIFAQPRGYTEAGHVYVITDRLGLSPCTERTYSGADIGAQIFDVNQIRTPPPGFLWVAVSMFFTDGDGQSWKRTAGDLDHADRHYDEAEARETTSLRPHQNEKSVTPCGDDLGVTS
jgi:hypothetical protein